MFEITPDIWIVSDTHFLHKKIQEYCGRPDGWQNLIINNWHDTIRDTDVVLHLGDLGLGNSIELKTILQNLPGYKFMLRGNHDSKGIQWYEDAGFTLVGDMSRIYWEYGDKRVLLSHFPDAYSLEKWDINIHGHIHTNGYAPGCPSWKDYRNVSCEVMDYRPAKLIHILELGAYQSRLAAGNYSPQLVQEYTEKGRWNPGYKEIERYPDA